MFNRKNSSELPINVILTSFGRFCSKGVFLRRRKSNPNAQFNSINRSFLILVIGIASLFGAANSPGQFFTQHRSALLPRGIYHYQQVMEPSVVATDLDEASDLRNEIEVENELVPRSTIEKGIRQIRLDFIIATRQSLYPLLYDLPPPYAGLQS